VAAGTGVESVITGDNVSVDVSAVAYYRVADVVRSVVAIENVSAANNQIAQTTLRATVGRHSLDETLSETDTINQNIREILDVRTEEWGIQVTVVELKDILLPESMKRAMARQAEAEREKRAKIIAAQGEALAAGELAAASDVMLAHPFALQLRNVQTLAEIALDRTSSVVFPAPLMSTIQELGAFLNREATAAGETTAAALGARRPADRKRRTGPHLTPTTPSSRPAHAARSQSRNYSERSRRPVRRYRAERSLITRCFRMSGGSSMTRDR
jgi:hypothetical protein